MAKYITEPQATVLADSINQHGDRLTTMEVTMHRFVLAEFNTHRVFSRNSASSRAIPGRLQRERVLESPAMPLEWPESAKGMQGGATLPNNARVASGAIWREAARSAVIAADALDHIGVHKSVTNRLLEPFLMQTVIVTSTEWDNFFAQRDSELAQPEIAVPARLMREAYEKSTPRERRDGEWHLPLVFIDQHDTAALNSFGLKHELKGYDLLTRVSAARCARVSYLTHDGVRDIQADLDLYDRLVTADPPHWSPLEHVAIPCNNANVASIWVNEDGVTQWTPVHDHRGNFTGWDQLRHLV